MPFLEIFIRRSHNGQPSDGLYCPLARSTIVCDVRYGRLRRTSTIQRLVGGPLQPGSPNDVSFAINLDLAFPQLRRSDAH